MLSTSGLNYKTFLRPKFSQFSSNLVFITVSYFQPSLTFADSLVESSILKRNSIELQDTDNGGLCYKTLWTRNERIP